MTVGEKYRACAAKGMTVVEIARLHGVTPQNVRRIEREHGLSIRRTRPKIAPIEAKLSPKELEDFRFMRSRKFTAKEALTAIGRTDLLEGPK